MGGGLGGQFVLIPPTTMGGHGEGRCRRGRLEIEKGAYAQGGGCLFCEHAAWLQHISDQELSPWEEWRLPDGVLLLMWCEKLAEFSGEHP